MSHQLDQQPWQAVAYPASLQPPIQKIQPALLLLLWPLPAFVTALGWMPLVLLMRCRQPARQLPLQLLVLAWQQGWL